MFVLLYILSDNSKKNMETVCFTDYTFVSFASIIYKSIHLKKLVDDIVIIKNDII